MVRFLTFSTAAPKLSAKASITVGEVKNVLRQRSGLYDTSNLDGTFLFDEVADSVQQLRRELLMKCQRDFTSNGLADERTSEYHLACHAISLIKQPKAGKSSPVLS